MQISDIHLERYGTLTDILLSGLSGRLTVYWGPNGCGKSTMVRFVRSMLFGFSEKPLRRVPSVSQNPGC